MSEIKPLREKISELEHAGKERDKKLDKILFHLENDETTGTKGLVFTAKETRNRLEQHLTDYETDKKVQQAKTVKYSSILGMIFGAVTTGLIKFFSSNQ